jgi:hypothetical protein
MLAVFPWIGIIMMLDVVWQTTAAQLPGWSWLGLPAAACELLRLEAPVTESLQPKKQAALAY